MVDPTIHTEEAAQLKLVVYPIRELFLLARCKRLNAMHVMSLVTATVFNCLWVLAGPALEAFFHDSNVVQGRRNCMICDERDIMGTGELHSSTITSGILGGQVHGQWIFVFDIDSR